MKKLFLFTVALLTCLMVGATIHTLKPGENKIEGLIDAGTLADGDVIELTGDADHVYTEWHSITIDKAITLRAAEGAKPVVKINKWIIAAAFEADDIEFTNLGTDYMLRTDANLDATITLKNCYMHDSSSPFVYTSSNTLAGLVIDNCIFANNTRAESGIILSTGEISNFEMRNSTIYNCTGILGVRIYNIKTAVVDHCTFYNNGERVLLLSESSVPTSCAVSNCVVSNPTEVTNYCIATYGGTVDNCVYYNTAKAPRSSSPVVVNGCINADPLFADPANGDFNFAFTSPLFLAATDGTHIGDLRWGVAEPETAIAVPDTLPATQAVLCGTKISASENGIAWNNNSENPNDNSASWVIDVAKAGNYEVVIYEASTSGHSFMACVANNETWLDTITEKSLTEWTHNEDITIGAFTFDAPGKYLVRLMNGKKNSCGIAKYCIMNYAGGAVVDIPDTLPNEDAVLMGEKISRDAEGYIKWGGATDSMANYAFWNINVEKAGYYDVLLSTETTSGREYHIYLYDGDEQKDEVVETRTWSAKENENLGRLYIESAGLYVIRAYNLIHNSSASIVSLTLNYAGGAVINVPATLPNEEALLTGSRISRTAAGIAWGDNGDVTEDYATWNISVAEAGDYLVTMAVRTGETSEHEFFINIYDGESQQVGDTITETTKTPINLAAGTYTVHLGNNKKWSSAVMASVAIKSAGGTVVEMPGTLQAGDALLGGDDNVKVDGDGYICFSKGEKVPNCWATWQTNWVKTGTYDVILDVNATNGHKLVVEVLDGETVIETFEHGYSEESGKLSIGKFELSETKSYTIRLTNKQTWSNARIKSIAFIPFITIGNDDTNVDFTEYENQFVSVQFNRTFTGGMYNPICVPFALSSSALSNILKADKSYVLDSASLEEQKLYVELKQGSGIYQGTPNMIKPSEDVENPVFTNVEIKATSPDQTTRGVLRLQGSFASHAIDNPQNALLVGANNTLFFPNDETPPYIKSMRAYFILVGQAVGAPIKAACFREPGNAPTEMIIVGGEAKRQKGHRKVLVDGQIRIQHEGKCYSILGLER